MDALGLVVTLSGGLLGTLLLIVVKLLLSLNARIDKQQERSDERFDIHTKRLAEVHAEILANREETRANAHKIEANRKELGTFRDETRENFKTLNKKIEANDAAIQSNAHTIDAGSARIEGAINTNAAKIEAGAVSLADLRDQLQLLRTENREDSGAVKRSVEKVGEQVGSFRERLASVEGRMGAIPA